MGAPQESGPHSPLCGSRPKPAPQANTPQESGPHSPLCGSRPKPAQNRTRTHCTHRTEDYADHFLGANNSAYPSNSTPPPSPVMPGIEKRFRAFVDFLRTRPNWSEAAAETLGVNGPQVTRPDPATLQPVLTLALSGGRVEVGWKWGPARGVVKALRIEVDRGNGWEFLTIDTQPDYVDTHPLPATAQKWKYRAIWVIDQTLVGQWSAVVDLAVSA